MPIQKLNETTINKIAAGEVIDRPTSVVKELLENALDAQATQVKIELEDGGKKRIRISDNGVGIPENELPLAPIRHATSKITSINDVYNIESFGFRGEALSSICHVAKLTMTSKTAEGQAYELNAFQDDISTPSLTHRDQGTTVDVQDLFMNIPVRERFLKSASTELAYCYDVVLHYALIHPEKDFILSHNGKELINTSGISDLEMLLIHVFGKSLKEKLIHIDETFGDTRVTGFITDPTLSFANRQKQIFSINQRLVKSAALQKAVMDRFRDVLPHRRFPLIALNLSMPPALVDVNVHPQKAEVKFLQSGFMYDVVSKSLKAALSTTHGSLPSGVGAPGFTGGSHFSSPDAVVQQMATWEFSQSQSGSPEGALDQAGQSSLFSSEDLTELSLPHVDYLQSFDTYLVVRAPDKLWILDQHAVHERILYEEFKASFERPTTKQPLLISEVLDLSPDLIGIYEDHQSTFSYLNFVIELFGNNQLIIREVPIGFADVNISTLVKNTLEDLKETPGFTKDFTLERKEMLQMKACKAAIKAGKKMSEDEVRQLVQDFVKAPSNFTCPHGRPLAIAFSKHDLEKLFLRV